MQLLETVSPINGDEDGPWFALANPEGILQRLLQISIDAGSGAVCVDGISSEWPNVALLAVQRESKVISVPLTFSRLRVRVVDAEKLECSVRSLDALPSVALPADEI
jgi:hypothetical protein